MLYIQHFWWSTHFETNNLFEGVRVKKLTIFFEAARHIHKKYRMQKIWSKLVISALWSAESNLQRPM